MHLALRHETWCKQKSLRFLFWSPSFENFAWSLAPVAEYISQLGPSTSSETLVMSDLQRCWLSIQYLSIRQQPYLNKQKTFRFYDPIPISFSMGTKISKVHAIQRPRTLRDLNDLDYPGAPKKSFLLHPGKPRKIRSMKQLLSFEGTKWVFTWMSFRNIPQKRGVCKAYLFSKKRLLPVCVLAVLPSRDFQIRHWWLTWRRLWQTLDSTDSWRVFFFSGHEKSVKGRFGARNFDPNCFGVVKIHAKFMQAQQINCP